MSAIPNQPPQARVERQIVLPLNKAVEIAYKSIRLRLSRSLLVTSGIVLALAFLMSIRTTDAMTDGMRSWAAGLREQRQAAAGKVAEIDRQVKREAAKLPPPAAGGASFDPEPVLGKSWAALQKEFGALPLPAEQLSAALAADPGLVETMKQWVAAARDFNAHKAVFNEGQVLEQEMKAKGVPTDPEDIASNRTQTRWLLGLALMVAFVGILNAMLMSVTERFREIGTMKCLGALDGFIIKLFLIESLFQGVVGTLVGIALGLLLSMAGMTSSYHGYAWKNFPALGILMAAAICLLVGVGLTVAGAVYPAWQAARMQPIEAMRVEA